MFNVIIAVTLGTVMGVVGTVAGVAAYQGTPEKASNIQLYSYADN